MNWLQEIFIRHAIICWILDFTYWCFIGFLWLVCTLAPIMLVKYMYDIQENRQ